MPPDISLISSFNVNGTKALKKAWPDNANYVELYTFMQSEIPCYFPTAKGINSHNALEALAWACDHPEVLQVTTNKIKDVYGSRKIVAFATFLPELMTHEWSNQWLKAQKAIIYLIKLARILKGEGHPIGTIQLVSGSRTNGVWRAKMKDESPGNVVNRMSGELAIQRLLARIETVANFAAQEPVIQLAFDFEPGPLFTIGNRDSIREFSNAVEASKYSSIKRVVGLNLNIGNWDFLGGIRADWVQQHEAVFNRIVHCHASDHKIGYFSDQLVHSFHTEERFKEWLSLLRKRMGSPGSQPSFSGFISCKLEACNHGHMLTESVNRSLKLFV